MSKIVVEMNRPLERLYVKLEHRVVLDFDWSIFSPELDAHVK